MRESRLQEVCSELTPAQPELLQSAAMSLSLDSHTQQRPSWYFRVRPIKAIREMINIQRNPDDLLPTARFFFYVGGHDDGSTYTRILESETATRILQEREPLPAALINIEQLRSYEEGTLGRCHAEFLEREGLDPAKIDADTRLAHATFEVSAEHEFIRVRTRSLHDLIHTLTGYGIDMLGEGGAVAFTFGNIRNRGYLMLTLTNLLGMMVKGEFRAIAFMVKGYRRGRAADFLWSADWPALLAQPLAEVREQLKIGTLAPYEPVDFDH
ncbi:MAG: ubiquinone biosynthesis protein COQ4 [Myxococcota bacterium]|jgi:ubiquinone biosynthesis protein COQ4